LHHFLFNTLLSGRKKRAVLILGFCILLLGHVISQPPSGYYNSATGLSGTALQLALHNIIKDHTVVSYTPGVWNAFYTTDDKPDGTVWDMYSDIPDGTANGNPPYTYQFGTDQCGSASQEGDCYSREHSFPKSWFNDASPMVTDLFHIIPTDQYVNNMRSNYPYGEVAVPTWTSLSGCKVGPCVTSGYSGVVFEPRDEYKGDLARNYFYMAVRYYTQDSSWPGSPMVTGSQLNPWALAMMLDWHTQDPVSQKEIDRNNAVYAIQDNRNPFIDHPEYAAAIWGPGPVIKAEPTNHATNFTAEQGLPVSSSIFVIWNDATGAVIPDAYLIKGSSTGYLSITSPVDGNPVPDGDLSKNVAAGAQNWSFTGLNSGLTYYFKIFPYTNSGANIDFKTNGDIPVASASTATAGSGTLGNPLTCGQAISNNAGDSVWVLGYLTGTVISTNNVDLVPPFTTSTNVAMADNATETNTANMLYVQLVSGVIRDNLNLNANPPNYHKKVIVKGNLGAYFTHPGLKSAADYKWYEATSSVVSGNWGNAAIWSTGIPYRHDNVNVFDTIHVNTAGQCNDLIIFPGGLQVIDPTKSLNVRGSLTIPSP
jgi:endonuclease I